MNQLPAYLANIPASGLAARAVEGIGGTLPPHISIRSNRFKLVDASGAEQMVDSLHLDVCVADISDVMCKMFYEADWQEGSTEPPACWSANGLAPSIEAISPQSDRCDTCEWNKRGSATSLKGKPTKACRDEKYLAVLIPGYQMAFRLVLTPGSFVNWRAYVEKFKGQQFDLCHVLTRLSFDPQQNGVLVFQAAAYIDEATAKLYTVLRAEKKSDILVGRNDRPRLPSGKPADAAVTTNGAALLTTTAAAATQAAQGQPQGFQPAPFGGATAAANPSMPPAAQPSNGGAVQSAQSPSEPARRRRRTRAEIDADNATAGGQAAQQPSVAQQPGQQTAAAPFAQPAQPATAPFAQPAGNGQASFGIATGAPPPPAGLESSLDELFGTPAQGS